MRADILKADIAALFVACPELAEDEQLRADMLEGETDFLPTMSKLVRLRALRIAEANGLADYIDELSQRKARKAREADAIKETMLGLMNAADLDKLQLPEATLSVTKPRASVDVTDPDALPQGYFLAERKPIKTAIKDALEAGQAVPGAAIVYGTPGLTVRVK